MWGTLIRLVRGDGFVMTVKTVVSATCRKLAIQKFQEMGVMPDGVCEVRPSQLDD